MYIDTIKIYIYLSLFLKDKTYIIYEYVDNFEIYYKWHIYGYTCTYYGYDYGKFSLRLFM